MVSSSRNPSEFDVTIDYDEGSGTIHNFCTSRGFPLGGIGTGGFNILTDGGFAKFRTNHNWFRFIKSTNFPKGTFFALRTKYGNKISAKILRRSYQKGKEYKNIENIGETFFTGKIPHFKIRFRDQDVPVNIELSGFTSLIPQNIKDSSLPTAFFRFIIENPTDEEIETSIMYSFENILGLGGSGGNHFLLPLDGPVAYRRTRGNFQEKYDDEIANGIILKTKQNYGEKDPRRRVIGDYLIYTSSDILKNDKSAEISYCYAWNSKEKIPEIFKRFKEQGNLNEILQNQKGNSGAFCIKTILKPNERKNIDFYCTWFTPFYVIEKQQRIRKYLGNHIGKDYGHYYLNYFSNISELSHYCINERDRLERESLELENILKYSTLPNWLQTYILNSVDSILVNTCLTKEGKYYMIEGCPWDWVFGGLTGTIDQRLASHPYSSVFFTELDKSELMGFRDLSNNGRVPHGTGDCDVILGSEKIPYGSPLKIFNKTENWTDLPQSFILQIGKMVMITGDISLLEKFWHDMVEMIDYLDSTTIDSIPDGITTYDYAYYRPHFVYSAILHIATLQMMIYLGNELLKHIDESNRDENENKDDKQKDNSTKENENDKRKDKSTNKNYDQYNRVLNPKSIKKIIKICKERYKKCDKSYQKLLWNPKGYFQTCSNKDTIFTAALAGDWISRYSGLSAVVDYEKAKSHSEWQTKVLVDSYQYTRRKGKITRPRVYREADINGNEKEVWILGLGHKKYANNPWQSLAYQGMESIYLGRVDEGLRLVKRIWEKGYYEGYPWNMNNWGFSSHIYMTHPTMWSIFNSLTGVSLDLLNNTLTVSPKVFPGTEHSIIPVFFPTVWFRINYKQSDKKLSIEVIKTFNSELFVDKIRCLSLEQEEKTIRLEKELKLITGNKKELIFPF